MLLSETYGVEAGTIMIEAWIEECLAGCSYEENLKVGLKKET